MTSIAGFVCFVVGIIAVIIDIVYTNQTKTQAKKAAEHAKTKINTGDLQEQDKVSDAINSVANLAKAMKDLDVGNRVLVIALAFFAVAAVTAGVDSIANAVGK